MDPVSVLVNAVIAFMLPVVLGLVAAIGLALSGGAPAADVPSEPVAQHEVALLPIDEDW